MQANWKDFFVYETDDPLLSCYAGWCGIMGTELKTSFTHFKSKYETTSENVAKLLEAAAVHMDTPVTVINTVSHDHVTFGMREHESPNPSQNVILLSNGIRFQVVLTRPLQLPGLQLIGTVEQFWEKISDPKSESDVHEMYLQISKSILDHQKELIHPLIEFSKKIHSQENVSVDDVSSALTSVLHLVQRTESSSHVEVPTILIGGTQSHGKSSALSRLLQANIGHTSSGTATKRPVFVITMNSTNPEFVVYNKSETIRVERLEEVLSVLEDIMAQDPDIDPVTVLLKLPGVVGSRYLDLIGLVHNTEGRYQQLSKLAMFCCHKYFNEYIVDGNEYSCAIFVSKLGAEAAEITWGKVINSVTDQETKYKIVTKNCCFIVTHGDELASLVSKGVFDHCKSWTDVRKTLFQAIYEVVGTEDIRCYMIASTSTPSREFARSFSEDPENASREYQAKNKEKYDQMVEALNLIASKEAFVDDAFERRAFFETIDVNNVIRDVRLRCFSGVLDIIPKLSQQWNTYLFDNQEALKIETELRRSIKEQNFSKRVLEYFRDFSALLYSLFTGNSFMSKEVNPSFDQKEWVRFTTRNRIDYHTLIKDSSQMPLAFDNELNKTFNEQFEKDLQNYKAETSVGSAHLIGLAKEFLIKLLLIKPEALSKQDIDANLNNGVLQFDLMNAINVHLNIFTERVGTALASSVAESFSAIMQRQVQLVIDFMNTKMNYGEFSEKIQEDLLGTTMTYVEQRTKSIEEMVNKLTEEQMLSIDPIAALLNDMSTLLSPLDPSRMQSFCKKFPSSPFSQVFVQPVQQNRERQVPDDKFIHVMKSVPRFYNPHEIVKSLYTLSSYSTNPDTYLLVDNVTALTDADMEEVNYTLKRLAAARCHDLSKGIYTGLLRFVSQESSGAVLSVRGSQLFDILVENTLKDLQVEMLLRNDETEENGHKSRNLKELSREEVNLLIDQKYDSTKEFRLRVDSRIEQLTHSYKIIREVGVALSTFFDYLQEHKERLALELVSLHPSADFESIDI